MLQFTIEDWLQGQSFYENDMESEHWTLNTVSWGCLQSTCLVHSQVDPDKAEVCNLTQDSDQADQCSVPLSDGIVA